MTETQPTFKIGKFTLSRYPEGISLTCDNGEGMMCSEEKLESVILDFFAEEL